MKVLLANSAFGGGGVTTYAKQLISCLSSDTELIVILGDDEVSPIKDERVKVIYHSTTELTLKNALFFIRLINDEIKPDVIIVSAATIIPIVTPYLDNSIKVITVSHSGMFFMTDYCAFNHRYIDNIIAASSDYNKKYLEERFGIKDKEKIKVIYNFLERDLELESLREKKPKQKPISIVFVAGSSVHKSPELVAKVVTKLLKTDLDFRFYWMGKPVIPLVTTLFKRSRIQSVKQILPEDERLIFPGYIADKRDFDKLIGSANIILAPSINEGCSMALLEGHRAGSIFIVGDYKNSNREIVSKANSGFVINHKDVVAFVDIIKRIALNPEKYSELYENSHNAFLNLLTYPIWRDKVFEVINSKTNHKKRREHINKFRIWFDVERMKWYEKKGLYKQFFKLSLPSYLSFRKQYHLFRKTEL